MLTGAARAARRMGGTRLERVWIVALPVVVLLLLERLYFYALMQIYFLGNGINPPSSHGILVGRTDSLPVRTALVATGYAAAGYALVWAFFAVRDYVRSVRRRGKRFFLTGAGGRLLVLGALFLIVAYEQTVLTSIPSREEVMADARAGFQTQRWESFWDVIVNDVQGVRRLCRENLTNPSRAHRLMAAAGLHRLGDGDEETTSLLRSMTLEEFADWGYRNHYVLLFRPNLWPDFDGLDGDGGEPWRRYRESFPE